MHKIDKFGYQYTLKKLLGRGAFGQVCLYERVGELVPTPFNDFFYDKQLSKRKYCAIKYYFERFAQNEGLNFSTLRQLNLMLSSNHLNIVSAHQAFYHRQKIQIVMDFYLDLPELVHQDYIMKDQDNKKLICYQITKGLAKLHQCYILHRDLKPQNIFISRDGYVKIGDFGLSKQYGTPNKKFTPYVCTRQYRAPQLFLNTNYYTSKADIWSLACIFYFIYTGQTLFFTENKTELSLITKIFSLTGTPDQTNWIGYRQLPKIFQFESYPKKSIAKEKGLPQNISSIIQACLNLDPKKRPTAQELLQNQYFSDFQENGDLFSLDVLQLYDKKLESILNKA